MIGCKPISIPLEQNVKLSARKGELLEDLTMYKCIVGTLIYMTITKPNLSYDVGLVSQFMQALRKPHLDVTRRILRYVKCTLQYGLFYEVGYLIQVHGYMDASLASSIFDRRSTSGFIFSLRSTTINWSNKKQPITQCNTLNFVILYYSLVF